MLFAHSSDARKLKAIEKSFSSLFYSSMNSTRERFRCDCDCRCRAWRGNPSSFIYGGQTRSLTAAITRLCEWLVSALGYSRRAVKWSELVLRQLKAIRQKLRTFNWQSFHAFLSLSSKRQISVEPWNRSSSGNNSNTRHLSHHISILMLFICGHPPEAKKIRRRTYLRWWVDD